MTSTEEFFRKIRELGLSVSGGYAVQHYLPPELRSNHHDDIDLIMIDKKSNRDIIIEIGDEVPYIIKADQPRRIVYETHQVIDGIKEYIHIEVTDLDVPTKPTILRNGTSKRIVANIPTLDYLVARLIYGAGSITRPYNRELDDISYLSDIIRFASEHLNRGNVVYYLEKLAGGKSRADQIRTNLRYEISKLDIKDVIIRQKKRVIGGSVEVNPPEITSNEIRRYGEDVVRLSDVFGANGVPQIEHLNLKRRLHNLTSTQRRPIARIHGAPNETEASIWSVIGKKRAEELRFQNRVLKRK